MKPFWIILSSFIYNSFLLDRILQISRMIDYPFSFIFSWTKSRSVNWPQKSHCPISLGFSKFVCVFKNWPLAHYSLLEKCLIEPLCSLKIVLKFRNSEICFKCEIKKLPQSCFIFPKNKRTKIIYLQCLNFFWNFNYWENSSQFYYRQPEAVPQWIFESGHPRFSGK